MRALRTVLALIGAWASIAFVTSPASAHTGSYDVKYVDGSNLILLTFNTHQPVSRLGIVHNIRLYDLVGAPIPYDEVKVEIHIRRDSNRLATRDDTLIEDDTLPMLATNESKMTFAYPTSGAYTLTTQFFAGGQRISRGEFAIDIAPGSGEASSGSGPLALGVAFVVGVAVGMVLLLLTSRRLRSTNAEAPADGPATEDPRTPEVTRRTTVG